MERKFTVLLLVIRLLSRFRTVLSFLTECCCRYGDVFKAYSEVNANTCAVKLLRIPKSSVDNQVSTLLILFSTIL